MEEKPAATAPLLESVGMTHTVTKLKGAGGKISVFRYHGGRMAEGQSTDYGDFIIENFPLRISVSKQTHALPAPGREETRYANFYVNPGGYVTAMHFNGQKMRKEGGIPLTIFYSGRVDVSYNTREHVTAVRYDFDDSQGGGETGLTRYEWEGSRLTHVISDVARKGSFYEQHSLFTFHYAEATPSATAGNDCIYLEEMNVCPYLHDFMWYAGLLGKTTRNIPTSVTHIYEMDGEEIEKYTYQIVPNYNDDNAITSLEYRDPSGYTIRTFHYGYENGGSVADSTYMSKRTMDNGKKAKAPRLARFRK